MDADDARLCLERHATSKIRRADDLGAIATLGFRGEALPSHRLGVALPAADARARQRRRGTEIRVNGGAIDSVVEAGAPEGTLDRSRRPVLQPAGAAQVPEVRRRRVGADLADRHAAGARAIREVGFTLTSAGRKVLQCRRSATCAIGCISCTATARISCDVRPRERRAARSHGFVAALAEQGPTRGPQHVFVNRRIVKDRTIAHAILDAYSVASIKERSPEVHLFLDMPPDRVDVNVHPTKAEVRFRDQSLVHEMVRRALGDALGRGAGAGADARARADVDARPADRAADPGRPRRRRFSDPWARAPARDARRRLERDGSDRRSRQCSGDRLDARRDRGDTGAAAGIRPLMPWASSATRSSSRSTTRALPSSTSTSRTSGCCSSGSWSG